MLLVSCMEDTFLSAIILGVRLGGEAVPSAWGVSFEYAYSILLVLGTAPLLLTWFSSPEILWFLQKLLSCVRKANDLRDLTTTSYNKSLLSSPCHLSVPGPQADVSWVSG